MNTRSRTSEDFLRQLVVAIDGPSASGKSTTARGVARELGLRHIDTGAMYRAVTLAALDAAVDRRDQAAVGEIAERAGIEFGATDAEPDTVFLDGRDVSSAIRSERVTLAVSEVSAHPRVRRAMVRWQRARAAGGGVVLEGRDIGSVVLPSADLKVFLDASVEERARRRHAEWHQKGANATLEAIRADIERRDDLDSSREASPLRRAVGAWRVDTTELTVDAQVAEIARLAHLTADRLERLEHPRDDGVPQRKKRLVYRFVQASVRWTGRLVFGMRVSGASNLRPEENYIFAPNHVSNADPPIVGCTVPRETHYVAKASLFHIPLLGSLIRTLNSFPIKRGVFDREAMGIAVELLQRGRSVLIFPEGGRVSALGFGPARSGVGYLAAHTGVAVVPIYIMGSAELRRCLFRRRKLRVVYGDPIRIPPELAAELRETGDREAFRRFSEMVMAAVAALRDEIAPDRIGS